jgi:hypothetical protein
MNLIRRTSTATAVIAVVAFAGGLNVDSALARFVHPALSGSFGPDGSSGTSFTTTFEQKSVGDLAVDEGRDRLYVVNQRAYQQNNDSSVPRLHGFDISTDGAFVPLAGFPVGAPGRPTNFLMIPLAVDNSPGSQGYVYYGADAAINSYVLDGALRENFQVTDDGFGSLATDSQGHLWNPNLDARIREYDSTGALLRSVDAFEQGSPSAIAIDRSTDDLYVGKHNGPIWKYPAARSYKKGALLVPGPWQDLAFDSAHRVLYVLRSDGVRAYNTDGGLIEEFATGIGGSLVSIAVEESSGTLFVSDRATGRVQVFPGEPVPDATTGSQVAKTTVSGHVDPVDGGAVTGCVFHFGTGKSYGSSEACSPTMPPEYIAPTDVEATLSGLVPETTYHYRLVVSNATGTDVGLDRTITPHWVDRITTTEATGLTREAATLNASFIGTGEDTNYFFEWGTTTSYGELSSTPPGDDAGVTTGPTSLSFDVSGLQPSTVYHYRVVASNINGTSLGQDQTFETLPAVHDISTDPADPVAPRSATLNASFTGDGTATNYYFEWGEGGEYGNTTAEDEVGGSTDPQAVQSVIAGLQPETTYHFRLVAENGSGTSYGADRAFTTPAAVAAVATGAATSIDMDTITLNGSYNGDGDVTYFYFDWGPTIAYGNQTAAPPGGLLGTSIGPTSVSASITDFVGFTTYHFRLVATNSQGTTFGPDRTFETLPALIPEIDATGFSNVEPTQATVSAGIKPNRWDTVYLFEYGLTSGYGSTTAVEGPIGSGIEPQAVSQVLSGLTPGTPYHFRVVALNFAGTGYGPDRTFTTPDSPRIDSSSASAIGESAAHLSALVTANASPTDVYFEYGTSSTYGSLTAVVPIGIDLRPRDATVELRGLTPNTTYYWRAVATNGVATAVGSDQVFRTRPVAPNDDQKCRRGFVKLKDKCACRKGFIVRNDKCACRKDFVKRKGKCVRKPSREHWGRSR